MRFLITSLQTYESEFYGVVGRELERRGHSVVHVTESRRSAHELREQGVDARAIQEVIDELGPPVSLDQEVRRIEATYPMPHLRDVYRNDKACAGRSEAWCIERTVDRFRALERIFDEAAPDVALPEVGNETIRIAAHLVATERGIPVLFILHTIFPKPLRVYVDTLHARIAPIEELRELSPEEREEVETFRSSFTHAATPIREFRRVPVEARRAAVFAGHVGRKLTDDRDNDYLHPWRLLHQNASEWLRARAARPFYDHLDAGRPFVFFPLHVTDDYKIQRIVPHCADQASLVEQVADALPQGHDLVLKEHPMSLGRNSIRLLRRLRRRPNVRLVDPYASTHELIRRSEAVAVIGSTVGLEALLYDKPVLTLGDPYYAGFGVTLDVDSFAELHDRVPELLRFRPDPERITRFLHMAMRRCHPGHPLLVDRSEENALTVADTLERTALGLPNVGRRSEQPAAAGRPHDP
jgi:Capsule polysaccharide biosynthesis protein